MRVGLRRRLCDDPALRKALRRHRRRYQTGEWPQSFVDCVFQYHWRQKIDLFDMYVLALITQMINSKDACVPVFQIPVGSEQLADRDVQGNKRLLGTLPEPFSGTFWGGTQDEDGVIRWKKPIHICLSKRKQSGWFIAAPGKVQLEAGYNSAGKMHLALCRSSGIARWPYGQKHITVFLNPDFHQLYAPGNPEFARAQEASGETIAECMAAGRDPFGRWVDEHEKQELLQDLV